VCVGPVLKAPQHVATGAAASLASVKAVEKIDAALEQTSGFVGVPGAPSGNAELVASLGSGERGQGDKSNSGELHVGLFWGVMESVVKAEYLGRRLCCVEG
jgi:hypothetical protein